MSIVDSLIYDRTAADLVVLNALLERAKAGGLTEEERSAFLEAKDRGAYNFTDLNRVTEAMEYIHADLTKYGYVTGCRPVEVEPGRTVWKVDDIPTVSQMAGYLDNLSKLRAVLTLLKETPQVPPDMDGLTIEEANDIERILADIDYTIERVVKSFARSNAFTVISGNRPLPSAESDLGRTWRELDAMNTTWRNWQAATWYLLLYGNLKEEGDVT